jgi:hypothetical protein
MSPRSPDQPLQTRRHQRRDRPTLRGMFDPHISPGRRRIIGSYTITPRTTTFHLPLYLVLRTRFNLYVANHPCLLGRDQPLQTRRHQRRDRPTLRGMFDPHISPGRRRIVLFRLCLPSCIMQQNASKIISRCPSR